MKKLMTLMLGLTFALGSVAVTFAQDKTDDTKMTKKKKAPKKKAPKKDDTSSTSK